MAMLRQGPPNEWSNAGGVGTIAISGISFLSHFVSLLISLLHIYRISLMAVHIHHHHFYPPYSPLLHSRLKTYLFNKSFPP